MLLQDTDNTKTSFKSYLENWNSTHDTYSQTKSNDWDSPVVTYTNLNISNVSESYNIASHKSITSNAHKSQNRINFVPKQPLPPKKITMSFNSDQRFLIPQIQEKMWPKNMFVAKVPYRVNFFYKRKPLSKNQIQRSMTKKPHTRNKGKFPGKLASL